LKKKVGRRRRRVKESEEGCRNKKKVGRIGKKLEE
jgi:hypothetical protein